jgi:1-deoxy-D-xylulose-5-phosphate reductoisomerase
MKKKIVILGSTGSIGKATLEIIKKDKKNFEIVLLTANNNIGELTKQIIEFNVLNVCINNTKHYETLKIKFRNKKVKIFNNHHNLNKIIKGKVDFTMSSISGLSGLKPTLDAIKFSKRIAIANKESIICGWNLIKKNLKKFSTEFVPVDSEHFSIWSLIENAKSQKIEEVIITASGGPFLNLPLKNFKKIKPSMAIKHPNWTMGKKISIDSATMMNKVFEVIEAIRIFEIDIKKFKIIIHPKSYVHAIVKFSNGLTKILIHDTDMKIPIFNSIYLNENKSLKTKKLNYSLLNKLDFKICDSRRYPAIDILKNISNKSSLFETILISANDELVQLFLNGKIKFTDIFKLLYKIVNLKEFMKYKQISPKNFDQINKLNIYVRLKTQSVSVLSPNV